MGKQSERKTEIKTECKNNKTKINLPLDVDSHIWWTYDGTMILGFEFDILAIRYHKFHKLLLLASMVLCNVDHLADITYP